MKPIINMEDAKQHTVPVDDEFKEGLDKEKAVAKEFLLDISSIKAPETPPEPLDVNRMLIDATVPHSFASEEFALLQDFSIDEILRLKKSLTVVAVQLRSPNPGRNQRVSHAALYNVGVLLSALYNLGDENRLQVENQVNAKGILKAVTDRAMRFPAPFQNIADEMFRQRETDNWGSPLLESPVSESPPPVKRRRGANGNTSRSEATSSKEAAAVPAPAPKHHPVFGHSGIMHHMLSRMGKAYVLRIDPTYNKKSAMVYGSNGLTLGDSWPLQIVALRDGAHGMRIGGIAGNLEGGAYSIVISGMYEDVDQDLGEEVLYSAPYSTDDIAPEDKKAGEKYLLKSIETSNPVRVLRNASGRWSGRPKMGLRYDGLYRVIKTLRKLDKQSKAFTMFQLKRIPGQEPIRVNLPTSSQMVEFAKAKLGY